MKIEPARSIVFATLGILFTAFHALSSFAQERLLKPNVVSAQDCTKEGKNCNSGVCMRN